YYITKKLLLLTIPLPYPMAATLGYSNRVCVSSKCRKVECDRLVPSCTACAKSKHNCQYTSCSPSQSLIYDVDKFINTSIDCNGNGNNDSINNNEHFLNDKLRSEQPHQRISNEFHPCYSNTTKNVEFSGPIWLPDAFGFNSQKQNDDNLEDIHNNNNNTSNPIYNQTSDNNNCCFDSPQQTLQQPQLLQLPLKINTSVTSPEIQITPDHGNDCDNNIPLYQSNYYLQPTPNIINKNSTLSTIAKLPSGKTINIYVPELEKVQRLLENNTNPDLPPAQLLFYLTLLNELAQQTPDFNINNAEFAKQQWSEDGSGE
ncbi:9342_t:CDS:2, partial [Entrophospora sp. SA101]